MEWDFNLKSFSRIYDYEQRKGNNIDKLFKSEMVNQFIDLYSFIDLISDADDINTRKEQLKILVSRLVDEENYSSEIDNLLSDPNSRKNIKKIKRIITKWKVSYIYSLLNSFSDTKDLKINKGSVINSKQVYVLDSDARYFFVSRVLQQKIKQVYDLSVSNRNLICSQLKSILEDNVPKIVIRADICSFYESIPFESIIHEMENDHLLSSQCISLMKSLKYEFKRLSGTEKGLPRGVGISAYLSEYYMTRKFDKYVKNMDGLFYYARFVDDIVAVFSWRNDPSKIIYELKKIINKAELCFHVDDSKAISSYEIKKDMAKAVCFDYLGYNFNIKQKYSVNIDMAQSKLEKQKQKMARAVDSYFADRRKNVPIKRCGRLLYWRFKLLTNSYYLANLKHGVVVGIKNTYPLLSGNENCFNTLDIYKENLISNVQLPQWLKNNLSKISFKNDIEKPVRVSWKNLKELLACWKNI